MWGGRDVVRFLARFLEVRAHESQERGSEVGLSREPRYKGWHDGTCASSECLHVIEQASRLAVLLAVVPSLLFVSPAYASTGVSLGFNEQGVAWGPETVSAPGGGHPNEYGQILVAYDRWYAALLALGVSPNDSRLDHTAMAKLSNQSTGGAFYTFAQLVHAYYTASTGAFDYPGWGGAPGLNPSNWGQFDMLGSIYGDQYIFWVQYTQAQFVSALEDLEVVLNGGSLGGGGGGNEQIAAQYTLDSVDFYGTPNKTTIHGSWTIKPKNESDLTFIVNVSSSVMQSASGYLSSNPYICVWSGFPGQVGYLYGHRSYSGYCNFSLSSSPWYINADNTLCTDGDVYTWTDTASVSLDSTVTVTINSSASHTTASTGRTFGRSGRGFAEFEHDTTPPIPDTNWPDAPTPEPTPEPTVPDPSDVDIDVTFPNISVTVDNDFTPDLQGILDAMDEHCQHLQRAIYNGFAGYFQSMKDFEEGMYTHYVTYFHDVTEWLDDWLKRWDKMLDKGFKEIDYRQYTANTYLSDILKAIKGISDKLDNMGRVITADDIPNGYDNTVNATSGSGTLKSAYDSLRTKFPFSVLDSLATLATRLKRSPVAPVFDVPIPNYFGDHVPYSIHFDFSQYSDWAAIIRTAELVLAYLGLTKSAARVWLGSGDAT